MIHQIKDTNDLNEQLSKAGSKLVLIDFMATWCGPCKMIGPRLEEMAVEMKDSIVVYKIDVDECEDLATEYGIHFLPTIVFIKNNRKVGEFSGGHLDILRRRILEHK